MKYTVKVEGEAALDLPEQDFRLEAPDGDAAAVAVRDQLSKLVSKFGGELAVVISCEETWTRESKTPRGGTIVETIPPGEVSTFSFRVEPHESVRKQAQARKLDQELATLVAGERASRRAEHLLDMAGAGMLTLDQARAALKNPEQPLESVVNEALAAEEAVSK